MMADHIKALSRALREQLAAGAAFRIKNFEFKGINLTEFEKSGDSSHSRIAADEITFEERGKIYKNSKNIFLVHQVRQLPEPHEKLNIKNYDVSVYLVGHKDYGHLNDIANVRYYFGHMFGKSLGKVGAFYLVKNGNDGFAVRFTAYGPTLCTAYVTFHDGSEVKLHRYLDFESVGYQYRPLNNDASNPRDLVSLEKQGARL